MLDFILIFVLGCWIGTHVSVFFCFQIQKYTNNPSFTIPLQQSLLKVQSYEKVLFTLDRMLKL
ncbi:hypothetical protein EZS27_021273 [termite gut metagenome]|uniref:Uncharacterized protein n=1 Tax=termite gut metagenome TaxID=433724 RepID=A0A5J4R8R1_9ZZZZ